jgi:hypothetical protein
MKNNIDQWSKYTLIQRNNKIWTKIKAKKQKLNAILEKENTRWTIRVKTRVFLAMETERVSLQNKHDVIQPFIAANKTKENWKRN